MPLSRLKKGVLLIIAVAAMIPFAWEPARSMVYNPSVEVTLYQLASKAEAAPVELNVQGWVKVKDKFVTMQELEALARKSAGRMGENNPQIHRQNGTDFRQVRIHSVLDDGRVLSLAAQSLINYRLPEGQGETYVTISFAQKISPENLPVVSPMVRSALFFPFSGQPQVLTNIVAAKPGRMSVKEQEALLTALFSAAEAKRIDGINTEQLCSVTGFTPEIKDSLAIGEKEVNLNIALRYHNEDGQTYINMGSPLLTGEY
jgi:hypothetical protein